VPTEGDTLLENAALVKTAVIEIRNLMRTGANGTAVSSNIKILIPSRKARNS
jgi:hypothetical protein